MTKRASPLHDFLATHGVTFGERYGVEIVSRTADYHTEYSRIRDAVAVSDFSWAQVFRVPEQTGLDFLDSLVAGNVARLRYGRVLHTFLADNEGFLVADCYVANSDDELVVVCESIVDDNVIRGRFAEEPGAGAAGVSDLSESHAVVGVDGFKAWAVVKELFGTDVLGLPYLSIEKVRFDGEDVRLIRAGKTSEFGYLIIAPRAIAEVLCERALDVAKRHGGGLCGMTTHEALRLEGRFFNIFAEGVRVRDPLPLGLQWMIDFTKECFSGREAILARRSDGVRKKIVGIADHDGRSGMVPGMELYDGNEKVGEIVASCHSYVLNCDIGLALLPTEIAYSGIPLAGGTPNGTPLRTISMPPIMPKSLTVRLDEL